MHQTADSAPRRKLSDIFSKDEIAQLTARSDWMGWRALLFTWGVIGLTFVALARWPHPLTWLAALAILGGRQRGLVAPPPGYLDVLRIVSARAPRAGL
jgi:DMSO reductase anchor subunit